MASVWNGNKGLGLEIEVMHVTVEELTEPSTFIYRRESSTGGVELVR